MFYICLLIAFSCFTFFFSKNYFKKRHIINRDSVKATPNYYGICVTTWLLSILALTLIIFYFFDIASIEIFVIIALLLTLFCNIFLLKNLPKNFHPRKHIEKLFICLLKIISIISISITILIVLSILIEALRFFAEIPITNFLFGTKWNPQDASHGGDATHSFGAVAVFLGTFLITFIAIIIAVPFGIFSAIFLTEYASKKFRSYIKPILEILAGIPTVVYGYFAAFTVAPFLKLFLEKFGISMDAESALAAGIVMGIMIIPFVLSLSDDVIHSVPEQLRNASLGLGSTKSEMITKVVIPAAIPGISGAVLLAISRAIGETMIVTMAAGLNANMSFNPLDSVTTATAQIVTLLVGDQEFDSSKTLAAFALGITLFTITLILNLIALIIVKKYREKYE